MDNLFGAIGAFTWGAGNLNLFFNNLKADIISEKVTNLTGLFVEIGAILNVPLKPEIVESALYFLVKLFGK